MLFSFRLAYCTSSHNIERNIIIFVFIGTPFVPVVNDEWLFILYRVHKVRVVEGKSVRGGRMLARQATYPVTCARCS